MNAQSAQVLRASLTHLRAQRDQLDVAIAAVLAVLGEHATTTPPVETVIVQEPRRRAQPAPTPPPKAAATKTPTATRRTNGSASSHVALVLDLLRKHPAGMRPKEIATAAHLSGPEVKAALGQLRTTRQVVASGATLTRTYRAMAKPNGKADEFVTVWDGSSKRPLTVPEVA